MGKYEEALERAKAGKPLDEVFPELKESEDERIRKAIESVIRVYGKTQGEWIAGYDMDTLVVYLRDAFAYLEKQKEQKSVGCGFEIGDTITDGTSTFKIVSIQDEHYIADDGDKVCFYVAHRYYTPLEQHREQKPAEWNIKDAKRGDILSITFDDFTKIVMFISLNKGYVEGYGVTLKNGKLWFTDMPNPHYSKTWTSSLKPATEEQIETFMKIALISKSAEWSEEDDAIHTHVLGALGKAFMGVVPTKPSQEDIEWFKSLPERFNLQPKQEWSKEDENHRKDAILAIQEYRSECIKKYGKDPAWADCVDWLKSINPQPKQEWSEEDERMRNNTILSLQSLIDEAINDDFIKGVKNEISWLKSLRPQPHWKPSEEQMNALKLIVSNKKHYAPVLHEIALDTLYNDLQKL